MGLLPQNFQIGSETTAPIHHPPSFQEFAHKANEATSSAPLVPSEPVLDTEIQQISADEFNRNMKAAEQATRGLRNLKLPRSLKEKVESLEKSLVSTKRTWEETGEIPDDEAIKIHQGPTSAHSSSTKTFTKKTPRKKIKRDPPTKPVDLLNKELPHPPAVNWILWSISPLVATGGVTGTQLDWKLHPLDHHYTQLHNSPPWQHFNTQQHQQIT
ncbi:hypothetical protein PGTUg99_018442 [Puccinia graminis f. sp. tritici]|uniref:Uncharacterized protein n=1 Tax=Puccinia graminis f. sp. tritici TaxID=56615 RepID=A0A5B0Q111_PUCGR|nr:hypothetical protein PGTUg99_018442 [Puccinia graminis f. sp. tritici]